MKVDKSTDYTRIEAFLKRNASCPTHWPEWNTIISKHYHTNFFYWIHEKNGEITGICPVHSIANGWLKSLYTGQFWYIPYGGWLTETGEIIKATDLPLGVREEMTLFSLPATDQAAKYTNSIVSRNHATLLLDLQASEDEIWENIIDSKRRNMIRKAQKSSLVIEYVTPGNFEEFYYFYQDANQRYGIPSLTAECLSELFFKTENIHFSASFIRFEDRMISAQVMAYDKSFAMYWLGLNAEKMPNLGQGELLQWEAILKAKSAGCITYDLCYIEKERLPKIYEFKKGFSQFEVPVHLVRIRPYSFRLFKKAFSLISNRSSHEQLI